MLKTLTYFGFLLSLAGCIQVEKNTEGIIDFQSGPEFVSFSNFDLEQKEGIVSFQVGTSSEPHQLVKKCVDISCNQTRFDYQGFYLDFNFIADGDWTENLEGYSNEELDLMLQAQVREVHAEIRFYENYENTNQLAFKVNTIWPDFISGNSGNGITAFSRGGNYIFIDLDLDELKANDANGNIVTIDLGGSLHLDFLL